MINEDAKNAQVFQACPASRAVDTRLGRVQIAEFGEGPAVLCLHGAMGGYDQGLILARTVGKPGYHFIAVSRPGYLGTALSSGKSPEEQADLYAALLDALRIDRTAVAAVSGGGPSAIHFALRHPSRTSALVLISTVAGPVPNRLPLRFHLFQLLLRIPGFETKAKRRAAKDPESIARRSILNEELLLKTKADKEAWTLFKDLQMSTVDKMRQRFAGTVNDVEISRTCSYPLEHIAVPTLVMHGSEDPLVPIENHGSISSSRIPGAEFEVLDGGGHAAIFTHRNQARDRVTRFLEQHAGR